MLLGAIGIGTIAVAVLFVVVSVVLTLGVYYVASGEWLWEREKKPDGRNWSPPR